MLLARKSSILNTVRMASVSCLREEEGVLQREVAGSKALWQVWKARRWNTQRRGSGGGGALVLHKKQYVMVAALRAQNR